MSIETHVKSKENTLKLKWLRIELLSSSIKTIRERKTSLYSIRLSRERNVSRLTSSSITSLTNSGMMTFSRLNKRMLRLLANWRDNTSRSWRKTTRS
jgi:hypothetical protein